ncbi:MAG: amino acid ABC transporter permease [Lachnospiraceae bacterium]|nr:amino acid ABC transporter permease [Lachnospiraceae bacterium]MCD8131970.1 amino acid ABC transporter permease [Lachnospiraceae bacterium]
MDERVIQILVEAFPKLMNAALKTMVPLTILGFSFAMVISLVVALVQVANMPVFRQLARFYIWIFRGTPLLVQLFVVFYGLPSLGILLDAFPAAVLVFALNEGAYGAETMRAAIESVSEGQIEAGYCVGLNYIQIMWHIVLPQAMRTAFPSLSNALISMVKDTSLASVITVQEIMMTAQRVNARYYEPLLLYMEAGFVYLIFSTVLTWLQSVGEKYLNKYRGGNRT